MAGLDVATDNIKRAYLAACEQLLLAKRSTAVECYYLASIVTIAERAIEQAIPEPYELGLCASTVLKLNTWHNIRRFTAIDLRERLQGMAAVEQAAAQAGSAH